MHLDISNYNQNQIKAALAANIQTAIALWKAKDWVTYQTTRDTLLSLLRSGRGEEVDVAQMQFIYFLTTHLRYRFVMPLTDERLFMADLPPTHPKGDKAWNTASAGAFWAPAM
jgi:hypothetical protein